MPEDMRRSSLGSGSFGSPEPAGVGGTAGSSQEFASLIESRLDRRSFQNHNWTGTFFDYLDVVGKNPAVVRNAYQRAYDAILSYGFEKYKLFKKDCIRYHFFSDPVDNGALSSCPAAEGHTWGKVSADSVARGSMYVHADVTAVFPWLVYALLSDSRVHRKSQNLYRAREKALDTLQTEVNRRRKKLVATVRFALPKTRAAKGRARKKA